MAQAIDSRTNFVSRDEVSVGSRPAYQAYQILHLGFTVAPILAGLDKFFHFLVDWDQYLPPFVNRLAGGHGHQLMLAAGAIDGARRCL